MLKPTESLKLATDGVFTVDGRFSDRFLLKVSRQLNSVVAGFVINQNL